MRKKFKIFYPKDYENSELAGKKYKTPKYKMVVMNSDGLFFLFDWGPYYQGIQQLSEVLPKYDVIWE
jgi:hypothetical protein